MSTPLALRGIPAPSGGKSVASIIRSRKTSQGGRERPIVDVSILPNVVIQRISITILKTEGGFCKNP